MEPKACCPQDTYLWLLLIVVLVQVYKNVMEWLSPADQSEIHEAAVPRHEAGTGQWFLSSSAYQSWKTDPGASLWLYGDGMISKAPSLDCCPS